MSQWTSLWTFLPLRLNVLFPNNKIIINKKTKKRKRKERKKKKTSLILKPYLSLVTILRFWCCWIVADDGWFKRFYGALKWQVIV